MANLGTQKNPLRFSVHTEAHAYAIMCLCKKRGWQAMVRIAPDEPEDTADLKRIRLNPPIMPAKTMQKVGRNEPCPCGSGNKYKKCCA
jgi:SWIM/SEC-C metal-binding protein